MSDTTLKARQQLAPQVEQLTAPALSETAANAGQARTRIPLTVRTRTKVLRVAPPIDDGFRPFRVF